MVKVFKRCCPFLASKHGFLQVSLYTVTLEGLCPPLTIHVQSSKWTFTALLAFNSYSVSHDNWCTATLWNRIMTAQCEGMGEVGSARYEPALLPSCPSIRVLSYSNCQEIHSHQTDSDGLSLRFWQKTNLFATLTRVFFSQTSTRVHQILIPTHNHEVTLTLYPWQNHQLSGNYLK